MATGDVESTPQEDALRSWVEAQIGPISRFERLPRWRPSWVIDVQKDGETLPLFVKGAREGGLRVPRPIEFEGIAFRLMWENGIPAPRLP